jgi:hypothetical protein
LGCFLVGNRVAEGWHLLAAVENLAGYLGGSPELVFGQAGKIGPFLGTLAIGAMAVHTAFVAKENGAGALGGFGVRTQQGMDKQDGEKEKNGKIYDAEMFSAGDHGIDFLMP